MKFEPVTDVVWLCLWAVISPRSRTAYDSLKLVNG